MRNTDFVVAIILAFALAVALFKGPEAVGTYYGRMVSAFLQEARR